MSGVRTQPEGYKPHIDGLRAVSIVAVVAFHAGAAGFRGGFVGVDIFFVISGYLIINQIAEQLAAGRFSLADFYARRALRILPSYGAMLALTLLAAVILFRVPTEITNFTRSALFAPLFLTNFYFLESSGYFDASAEMKPLLHTWSLAVEEQFYLVVPLLMLGLFVLSRRLGRSPGAVLAGAAVAIGVASLVGCIVVTPPDLNFWVSERNPAFFMTWWRAWEFVAGGLVGAIAAIPRLRDARRVATMAGVIGMALIALSVSLVGLEWLGVRLGSENRVFGYPGHAALLPVVGAMLVIGCGILHPASWVARLLSLAPMVYLGQISYALYLWHWPLLVFGRFLPTDLPPEVVSWIAVALAVLLAVATRYAIELPVLAWRRRVRLGSVPRLSSRVALAGAAACVAVVAASYAVTGLALRAAENSPAVLAQTAAIAPKSPTCAIDPESRSVQCSAERYGLIVGDSHAVDVSWLLSYEAVQRGTELLWAFGAGCNPQYMMLNFDGAKDNARCAVPMSVLDPDEPSARAGADFAIVQIHWVAFFENSRVDEATTEEWFQTSLERLVDRLSNGGRTRVLLVAPTPWFYRPDVANCALLAGTFAVDPTICGMSRAEDDARRAKALRFLEQEAARHSNVRLVDPAGVFCDEARCSPQKDGVPAFRDTHHINQYGALKLFEGIAAAYDWAFVGDGENPGSPPTGPPAMSSGPELPSVARHGAEAAKSP